MNDLKSLIEKTEKELSNINHFREISRARITENYTWEKITDQQKWLTQNRKRSRIYLNGVRAVFHRSHPEKETDRGAVKAVRRFVKEAGVLQNVKI